MTCPSQGRPHPCLQRVLPSVWPSLLLPDAYWAPAGSQAVLWVPWELWEQSKQRFFCRTRPSLPSRTGRGRTGFFISSSETAQEKKFPRGPDSLLTLAALVACSLWVCPENAPGIQDPTHTVTEALGRVCSECPAPRKEVSIRVTGESPHLGSKEAPSGSSTTGQDLRFKF